MTNKKAPGDCANSPGSENQNPTYQEENQIMTIIPETDEVRQAVRAWAVEYAARMKHFGVDEMESPEWPKEATPWWAEVGKDSFPALGGETCVSFQRDFGECKVGALLVVVVDDDPRYDKNHPGDKLGDFHECDGGLIEVTIVGPHEDMSLVEAQGVSRSLIEATAFLGEIHARAAVAR